jgi:flagellar basal-body rod modification protein FlgD
MSISALTGSSGVNLTTQAGDNATLGKEEFLKLLISQMQNQDPLEPMQNSEFVAQLATFSNVEQLVSVNEGITNLGTLQMAAYDTQAANYIGKDVEVLSDSVNVTIPGEQITASFQLASNADTVIVNFRNSTGDVVRSMSMGPQAAGSVSANWNTLSDSGQQVPLGAYKIDVVASDATGSPISYQTRVRGHVDGVTYESGGPELIIGNVKALVPNIIGVYPNATID